MSTDQTYQLKEVSKAKLRILERYFPAWAKILGSRYPTLVYVDCFAGAGRYAGGEDGSPLRILDKAVKLVQRPNNHLRFICIFVEKNAEAAAQLRSAIPTHLPQQLQVHVLNKDAHGFVPQLLQTMPPGVPAFFFVDPFGYPLTIPVMNEILERPRTEILVNLMWWSINMGLSNNKLRQRIDAMFGDDRWQQQPFMSLTGYERESQFLRYFCSKMKAQYSLTFRIRFSPEDNVRDRDRTKYYLIHLSNHPKAVLLMKEVMWPIGDEAGTFDYSASSQGILISRTPTVQELRAVLEQRYCYSGEKLTFDELREDTWYLPFIESHYREAIRLLEQANLVQIVRIDSKRTGLKGRDLLIF